MPISAFTMPDPGVHDAPIWAFTMLRFPQPGGTVSCTEGATGEISDREVTVVPNFFRTPNSVLTAVDRDGREVSRKSVTPSYAESEPNGEGCGVRREGAVVVTIAP